MKEKYSPESQAVVDASPVNKIKKCGELFRSINDLVKNRSENFLKSHYFAFEIVMFDENRVHELKKLGISVDYLSKRYENIPSSTIEDTFVSITEKHIVLKFGDEAIKKIKAVEEMEGNFDPTNTTNVSMLKKVMNKKTFDKEMVEYVNKEILLKKIDKQGWLGAFDDIAMLKWLDSIKKEHIENDPSLKILLQIRNLPYIRVSLSDGIYTRMQNLKAFIDDSPYLMSRNTSIFNYINSDNGDNYYSAKIEDCELKTSNTYFVDSDIDIAGLFDTNYFEKNGIIIKCKKYSNGRQELYASYNKQAVVKMMETTYEEIIQRDIEETKPREEAPAM